MISRPFVMIGWLHVGGTAGLDAEAPALAILGGCRFGQADHALFAVEIQTLVRVDQRALPDAAVAPRHFARIELQRRQDAARKPVDVIADDDRRRVVVAHLAGEVDLLRRRDIARRLTSSSAAPVP